DPRHVLALTFTRKAAGEPSSRLSALGVRDQVAAGTFHAIAYAQLRRRWADRGERPPALADRKVRLLAPLLAGHRSATVQPADVANEIEWAKARFVAPADYETEATRAGRTPPIPLSVMASLYERYEEDKRRRGVVDFDDLLLLCARALQTDDAFAASQRWRFRHLFVDEFQDVNPVQFRLLEGWRGDRNEARAVVRAMRRRHNSALPWSGMAALARTNAQLLLLEEACTAAGVPHRVRGEGPFLSQREIRQALN